MARRTRPGDHAVDTAVEGERAAWALVGHGRVLATGRLEVRLGPQADSTGAAARGIAAACARLPKGTRLATDALQVVRAIRSRQGHHAHGAAGVAAKAAAEASVEVVWRPRRDPAIRAAHRAARRALREGGG